MAYISSMQPLQEVVETDMFLATAGRIMSDAEKDDIVDQIAASPAAGVRIQGVPHVRKLRVPLAGRGKRGGGRVVYWFYSDGQPIVLLLAYAKNAAADLSPSQKKEFAAISQELRRDYGG